MASMQQGYGSGSTPWYDFSVSSDYRLSGGGSTYQNTDVATPIDTVLSAPTAGTVTYLGYPAWGGQVTYKEDNPVDPNNPYVFLIHMDSINPNLKLGQHINAGTFLGFSGGQYPGQITTYPALPAGYLHHDTSLAHTTGPHLDIGVSNVPYGSLDNNQSASNTLVSLAKRPPPGSGNTLSALCASLPPSLAFILCGVVPPVQSGLNDVVSSTGGTLPCAPWDIGCLLQEAAPYALRVFFFIAGAVLIVVGLRILFPADGGSEGAIDKVSEALKSSNVTAQPAPAQGGTPPKPVTPPKESKHEKRLKQVETVGKVAAFL